MSDHAFTSTRQMAQSAAMKANDAYAVARDALAKVQAAREVAEEPDFDHIFDDFDRRLKELKAAMARLEATLDAVEIRLSALEKPPIAAKRKSKEKPL